jgi:hypothetical protein
MERVALSPTERGARPQPHDYLFRAATCVVQGCHPNHGVEPMRICKTVYAGDKVTPILLRGAVPPATVADPDWAGTVARLSISSLLQSIVSLSAAADLLTRALRISFDRLASIRVPGRSLNVGDAGQWLAEGKPIPVRNFMMNAGPTLTPHKLAVITTYTREIAASSNIEAVVKQLLSEAFATQLDVTLFGNQADTGAGTPAGLLNGVVATTAATGTDKRDNMVADIEALIAALAANRAGLAPVFVGAPGQVAAMKAWLGPWFDYPILPSAALPAGTLIAIEPASLVATIADAVPDFSAGEASVLHMEDTTPADIVSGGTAASPVKSMFQIDAVALKTILSGVSWAMRAPHVAFVQSVNW